IVNAALCRFKGVWMMGADLLFRVGAKNKDARDAVLEILTSKKAADRYHVICMLGYLWDSIRLPRSFMEGVIRTGLKDKSDLVRVEAAVAADRLSIKALIPDVETCLQTEGDADSKKTMAFHLAMLRDGYLLEYRDGQPELHVRFKQGWTGAFITQDDVDSGRLESIAAAARADANF